MKDLITCKDILDYVLETSSKDNIGLSQDERFKILEENKADIEVYKYLKEKLKNLTIEVCGDYEGLVLDLMSCRALEGWCWQTTESSIVFLNNDDYIESTDEEIEVAAERIMEKLMQVNSENLQWFEVLLGLVFAVIAYMAPIWLLKFQAKMRQLEMEDEVMQFNTIILMLMKIERVNVEIILEWLERYANIFKEPISKCVNNYESGAWEALEQLKEDVAYVPFIRIVESLQAAVEKIPITDAFDELDTERDYYQAKRKESNDRLISKKGMIGKGIGFAPMVVLFVGYLIVPLVFIGIMSMTESLSGMTSSAL